METAAARVELLENVNIRRLPARSNPPPPMPPPMPPQVAARLFTLLTLLVELPLPSSLLAAADSAKRSVKGGGRRGLRPRGLGPFVNRASSRL